MSKGMMSENSEASEGKNSEALKVIDSKYIVAFGKTKSASHNQHDKIGMDPSRNGNGQTSAIQAEWASTKLFALICS